MQIKNYSKRMVVTALTLFSVSLPSILSAQEEKGCSDLFISEIVKIMLLIMVRHIVTMLLNYLIQLQAP